MNKQTKISNDVVIKMANVKKMYTIGENGFWALNGINLEMKKGEFIAIVGKSGSGKSTLLNILGGIDTPTEGSIVINGERIDRFSENQLCRFRGKNIGFVFQFFQLMPTLTVLENVIMPMDFINYDPTFIKRERAMTLLSKVGLESQADKFPSSLSGGEQQRVAIARALANDPDIIFADEPTGNLDSNTTEDIFNLLSSLADEGKCLIMVTHNNELSERCGRIVRLKDGCVIEDIQKETVGDYNENHL